MKNQYASSKLTVNLNAVRENYRILKQRCSAACQVSAVVKADAYGLGVEKIALALEQEGCRSFFVANLDEAIFLRQTLPDADIYVFHGVLADQEDAFFEYHLTPVLNSVYQVGLWWEYAIKKQRKLSAILHFDTGMNRLGLSMVDTDKIQHSGFDIKYIMSHLACADDSVNPMNSKQLQELWEVSRYFNGVSLSLANSAGIFLGRDYHFDMVRPGVALYGANPNDSAPNPMRNVISLTTNILQIHHINKECTVGYGAEYKAGKGKKIATIPVGYADGYLRSLSNKGICAIDGIIVPVVGRVSMDLITLDVTDVPEEKLGVMREVELIGENIPVDVVAQKAGTIGYEMLTSLGARYKRNYRE